MEFLSAAFFTTLPLWILILLIMTIGSLEDNANFFQDRLESRVSAKTPPREEPRQITNGNKLRSLPECRERGVTIGDMEERLDEIRYRKDIAKIEYDVLSGKEQMIEKSIEVASRNRDE